MCSGCTTPAVPVAPCNDRCVVQNEELEKVRSFCYLGDTLSSSGGSDAAVTTRIRCAWRKFHELAPFLAARATPLKLKGKVYGACVRSAMIYGSETWAMKNSHMEKLERADNAMVRRMCGVRLCDRRRSEDLRAKLGLLDIATIVLRRSRLWWFGHVQRREDSDWIRKAFLLQVEGRRAVGRPRKTWEQTIAEDLRVLQLNPDLVHDRAKWKQEVWKRSSNPVGRDK